MATGENTTSLRVPRYEDEDTSPTTKRELRGWYSYGLAAEVFAVCGVGSFLPVTLEQLARERGVLWSDKTTPCFTSPLTGGGNGTTAALLHRAADSHDGQCIVRVFGSEITTASFAMYTFSLAVLVQAVVLISFSSVADHGNFRKKLLLGFGFAGATSSMLFLLVVPKIFLVGSFLTVIGVTCLGSSFVILNSFLPLLVMNHPDAHRNANPSEVSLPLSSLSDHVDRQSDQLGFEEAQESTPYPSEPEGSSLSELQLSTQISSKGVGIGYAAAVFMQVVSILILLSIKKIVPSSSATLGLRVILFAVGLWWFLFTIPSQLWLRQRPGPPLGNKISRVSRWRSGLAYVSFAWSSLWKTIKTAAKLRQVVLFLVAWFLLSDAVATVSGTAILFATTELHMTTVGIAILSITVTASGIAGAFTWPIISRYFNMKTNHTIICCICMMELIPLYGLLGYLPFVKAWGFGGLQQSIELYPLGLVHGFLMGGLSSYCRSFFGQLIPPNREAAFYALYAITDKGSSAVGPTIVGFIADRTGSIRPAFLFLAVLVALPVPLIWMVDADKGHQDALRMADEGKVINGDYDGIIDREEDNSEESGRLMNGDD